MTTVAPFAYPTAVHVRRHGPGPYDGYGTFKPWLRDEFLFRCVYCLKRERWSHEGADIFSVEHIVPQAVDSSLACVYENLLYACTKCNSLRGTSVWLNPTECVMADYLAVNPIGYVITLRDDEAAELMLGRLNSDERVKQRQEVLEIIRRVRADPGSKTARNDYSRYFGYPDDMEDLRKKVPHGNSKPLSTADCFYAKRERGEIAADAVY